MESICKQLAERCLDGSTTWPEALLDDVRAGLESEAGSRIFFHTVIEPLGDLFEPRLCDVYVRLMSALLRQPELVDRYQRVREVRPVVGAPAEPEVVYVLSRITLGADVAVTSVVLDAAKRRFPQARITFVAPRKNWELFAGDPRLSFQEASYGRTASFADRLAARPWFESGLVLDPDSRLSQLGLLAVTSGGEYRLFESRAYGAESDDALPELASRWCVETLGVPGRPYIAPLAAASLGAPPRVTVNLGVGENAGKRLPDPFEERLLALLPDGPETLIDLGGSPEEAERVRRAAGPGKRTFQGPFAEFAGAAIAGSELYVGYDSAGMHVAAACGVPLLCVFAGAISDRFFARWRPTGAGRIGIIRVPHPDPLGEAERLVAALRRSGPEGAES